jgi:hypothetical protein
MGQHEEVECRRKRDARTKRIATGLGMVYMNGIQATAYGMTADRVKEIERAKHWRDIVSQCMLMPRAQEVVT